ncbi:MAG TPA: hypothetical protein VHO69_04805 [Phototrophicaceae bacterium]|nr:hypothetical protein [Phototrophicaceae bacterium]
MFERLFTPPLFFSFILSLADYQRRTAVFVFRLMTGDYRLTTKDLHFWQQLQRQTPSRSAAANFATSAPLLLGVFALGFFLAAAVPLPLPPPMT